MLGADGTRTDVRPDDGPTIAATVEALVGQSSNVSPTGAQPTRRSISSTLVWTRTRRRSWFSTWSPGEVVHVTWAHLGSNEGILVGSKTYPNTDRRQR